MTFAWYFKNLGHFASICLDNYLILFVISSAHIVGMFYRQRMLVIDGKYRNDDGLSTGIMCQVGTRSILEDAVEKDREDQKR
jgi:hypothetical protein